MSTETFLSMIFGLISVALSLIGYYFYIRSEIYKSTEDAVNNAENTDKIGKEKLSTATEQLYLTVPTLLRPFFSKKRLEKAVQYAFERIEEYAKKQKR